jgi:hypothetical protein
MKYAYRSLPLVLALLVLSAGAAGAAGESSCTLAQLTASDGFDSQAGGLSANGRYLALTSRADLTGGNTDHGWDLFLYDRNADGFTQLTHLTEGYVQKPTLDADGSHAFYRSNVDPDTDAVLEFPQEVLVRLEVATGERTVVARNFADASVSGDGSRVALLAADDFTGGNGDGNEEIFLLDLASETYVQVTDTLEQDCPSFPGICPANLEPTIDADGRHVAFFSDLDPIASGDPSAFGGVYVYDAQTGATTRVILHATLPRLAISGDGGSVAFPTIDDLTGDNPVGLTQLFVSHVGAPGFQQVPGSGLSNPDPVAFGRQGTRLAFNAIPTVGNGRDAFLFATTPGVLAPLMANPGVDDFVTGMTPDGAWAALHSKANVAGGNPDGSFEVFLAQCAAEAVPPPPPGEWLTDSDFPDFQFKVRITAGGQEQPVRQESACIPETLCISGAVPGRSELFVRIVGPKPNGKLWPTLVRFSTSTIEVWIEQLSTSALQYYRLEGASPGSSDLTGLFDRNGFTP